MLTRALLSVKKFEVISFILILLLLVVFSFSETLQNGFYGAVLWGEQLLQAQPILGAVFFFFFSLVSAMLAFASSALLIPSAILTWGVPATYIFLLGGWIAGAVCTYWIGSRLARPALAAFLSEEKVRYYEGFVSQNTSFWIIFLFCLAAPSEISGYIFGTLHSRFVTFILAAALAEAIYAFGTILAVQGILNNEIFFAGRMITLSVILVVTASLILLYIQKKKNRTRR